MTKKKFSSRIEYELKRAERYRIFVSLIIFDIGPLLEMAEKRVINSENDREDIIVSINHIIRQLVRVIDTVSNSGITKVGLLCPETSRQGAEAAARRIQAVLGNYCHDKFGKKSEYLVPVEISSFPDAVGTRSIASYFGEFAN